jgi:hypothetical protein
MCGSATQPTRSEDKRFSSTLSPPSVSMIAQLVPVARRSSNTWSRGSRPANDGGVRLDVNGLKLSGQSVVRAPIKAALRRLLRWSSFILRRSLESIVQYS